MDELRIETNVGSITSNLEALKAEAQIKADEYMGVVVEDAKEAKKDLADMRKYKKDIEDRRKAVKKAWNEPYTDFESQVKDCLKPIDEAIDGINKQLTELEEKRKFEKSELCRKIFSEETEEISEYISYEDCFSPEWLNATCTEQTIRSDIQVKKISVNNDLEAIKSIHSEIEEDCLKAYRIGGLSAAISKNQMYIEAKAQAEARAKAEAEEKERARIKAEEEASKAEESSKSKEGFCTPKEGDIESLTAEPKEEFCTPKEDIPFASVTIGVYPKGPQLDKLIEFLIENEIEYEEL